MQTTSNNSLRRVFIALIAFVGLAMLTSCSRTPDEQALRERLDEISAAAENKDVSAFVDVLADDFVGNSSEFDKLGMERLIRLMALRHQAISVTRTGLSIEMHQDRAVVQMQVLITGGKGGLIPEQGQWFNTESAWRFVEGEWQLGSATWKPRQ